MSIMIISVACGMMIGSSSQTRLPDCTRKCCGRLNIVNMSIAFNPRSLSVYREMRARDVDQNLLDSLLDQTVGGIEERNTRLEDLLLLYEKNAALVKENTAFLETQLCQVAGDRMRLQVEVSGHRCVMDTRSLIELCAREYYKADNTRKGDSNSELVKDFIKRRVLVDALDFSMLDAENRKPQKDFDDLLKKRPEQLRVILSEAGFKGSSATWDRDALRGDLLDLYSLLSLQAELRTVGVHHSNKVTTLPFTGWCVGGPSPSAAAEIIVAITALEAVNEKGVAVHEEMRKQYNFPMKLLILDPDYKHVLTWQKNEETTDFELVTVKPPVYLPDPTPSFSVASSLAQGPDQSTDQSTDQSPEGTYGGPLRWVKRWLA